LNGELNTAVDIIAIYLTLQGIYGSIWQHLHPLQPGISFAR